ncbi:GMC family oxidoreductase [Phototrophicus methaneseepsis]|uniref:GMC family oxidoreductase n=1 Tax=Phototrophicus methaneseepsis TaxID=2710758 RepID=A0A7S8ICT3_9CHLR|nr:GMC family oxidoreductase N-terminal domain-containing protein [Phototrophicus methaneseepsis]QPC80639.1 GMC family oxidoreductase [Phototrophicus methaneseepsis]
MTAQESMYTNQHEDRLTNFLKILAAVMSISAFIALFLPYIFNTSDFFISAPFYVTNTIAGFGLIGIASWFAAADVRRFRPLVVMVWLGLIIGAVAMLTLAFSTIATQWQSILLGAFAIYTVLALSLGWLLLQAAPQAPAWSPWIPEKAFTTWERIGQIVYGVFGLFSVVAVIGSVAGAFIEQNPFPTLWAQPFFVGGSAVKIGLLGMISLYVAFNIRKRLNLITVVILGHAGSWVVITVLAVFGYARFGHYLLTIGSITADEYAMMFGAWLLDVVIIAGFGFVQSRINRSVVDNLSFFAPAHFRILESVVETLIEGDTFERIPPYQSALNTDIYLGSFHSNRLFLAKAALLATEYFPLMWALPPITYLSPANRRNFVDSRFKQEIITPPVGYRVMNSIVGLGNRVLLMLRGRSVDEEPGGAMSFTDLLEGLMRFDMQMTYLGYYGDERSWEKGDDGNGIGYVPFSKREKAFPVTPRRPHPPLDVMTPDKLARRGIDVIDDADVVIIGSGAAGGILAEQMLKKGRSVLMLERGLYSDPDTFNEDEIDMVSRLYSDGALQISQSLRFTILQGSAVGGTTVVNNAVCFNTPERVVDTWNSRGERDVIDKDRYFEAQAEVRKRMKIGRITAKTRTPLDDVLNQGDLRVTSGVQKYFEKHPELGDYEYDVVEANITDCLGCGYCNIGCKYGRKISMLDEVLPSAQAEFGPERFRILSEAEAVHLETKNGRVTEIVAMVRGKKRLVIKQPKTVIVSAGTIASSWLLMRSGIGKNLPVGRGLCFNMGSPLYGWFGETVRAYQGLQIAHYLDIKGKDGFVYETWYNPPLAQALTMPGWLDTHFANMQRYDQMAAVGVLVGTESNAHIERALLVNGPDVVYKPSAKDMSTLLDAFKILGGVLFEAGAKEVYASTRKYHSYKPTASGQAVAQMADENDLVRLNELIKDESELLLGTGHPQGGNAIGIRPDGTNPSVVDGNFKVFGYDNLYVCDASVHPTATTVNPQLTVMSLAHYAANFIE